ncbi:MAG: bifunctional DNA primase/polymerase, partial [Spirochaetales bacterium]|nr:bifunctional DNA primase/polymerase [Spirochaetales bacterium]
MTASKQILVERFAKLGCRIYPQKRDKTPAIKGWKEAATSDIEKIKAWDRQFPDCNWGIVTGLSSGVLPLDLDRHSDAPDGIKAWERLVKDRAEDWKTFSVRTPSGGRHTYFSFPDKGLD